MVCATPCEDATAKATATRTAGSARIKPSLVTGEVSARSFASPSRFRWKGTGEPAKRMLEPGVAQERPSDGNVASPHESLTTKIRRTARAREGAHDRGARGADGAAATLRDRLLLPPRV